jgi:uncharacterized protein YjfI (DUF2170 family)
MLIIGGMELITCLIANYFCDKMYRKISIIILMIISGCVGIFIQFTSTKSGIELALVGISRICNTFAFTLFSLITTESFPTSIKSTGTGVS